MQSPMSGASSPIAIPVEPRVPPEVVAPPEKPRRAPWWMLAVVLMAGAAGWALWRNQASEKAKPAAPAFRTATVGTGRVNRTVRLTGTTGAENFVSLISPQLRGSRSGRGQAYQAGGALQDSGREIVSNARGSNTASTASQVSSGQPASNGGTASSGSAALKAVTSRISSSGSSSASSSSSSSSSSGSSAMGSSGLGSTAAQLAGTGTGGGGGGGGDFMLVLQDVVNPGSHANKGERVAEFDRQYMLNRLDDYRSSVHQAEAALTKQIATSEVSLKDHEQLIHGAKADLDKALLDLKTIPVLSEMDAERMRLAADEAKARYQQLLAEVVFVESSTKSQIRISELDLQQTKLELRRAEANADKMIVKAAIPGLVVMQTMIRGSDIAQIQKGDQLHPGQQFMQIVDTRSMVVNASINQVDVEQLRIGAKATVHFDAYPDLVLPAHVYSIGAITRPGGMRAAFVKEVPVRLKLDGTDPRVIPDLSVSADVVIQAAEKETAVISLGGLFHEGSSSFVYVREGAAWVRRQVRPGLVNNISAAIEEGLKAGEAIALERPPSTAAGAGQQNRAEVRE